MTDQDRLNAAIDARHKLLLGQSVVEVDIIGSNGINQRTRFTPANREALEAYIAELQEKIAGCQRRGAVGIVF